MTDFDPNDDLDTQDQADAYINWSAENFMRLSQGPKRTYRTAVRCAAWLFVVASAQLHLDDEVENKEALLEQLSMYQAIGRTIERQRQHFTIERLIVLRSSLDCWDATGGWAGNLLAAAKCAVAAMILIELHPLVDLWELECPDVWAQLEAGAAYLANINDCEDLSFSDFAIKPDENVTSRFTWQRAEGIVRRAGLNVDFGRN